MQEIFQMTSSNRNEKIIQNKEKLAADVLEVAKDALEDIKVCMPEAGIRDLINVFNSAIKCHRELMSDVIAITDKESKEEQVLAKEYGGKVDELLKKITDKK